MNAQAITRRFIIIVLGVILIGSISSFSFAYWASSIVPPTEDNSLGDINVGTWDFCNLISTPQEFYDFATATNSQYTDHYCLVNDIDFSGFSWMYTTAHASNIFRGTFDGRGYTLSNIGIQSNSTVKSYLSIFSTVDGATIKNVNIENFSFKITSAFFNSIDIGAGIFAGSVNGNPVTFENIRVNNADIVTNIVEGAGGLTGQIEANTNVLFRNIKIRGLTVLSSSRRVGGLFSRLNPGTGSVIVEDVDIVVNLGTNDSTTYVGGLAGTIRNATFTASRVIVDIVTQGSIDLLDTTLNYQATRYTGGLIGNNNNASVIVINDSFVTGELYNIYNNAGAILGRKLANITFDEAYYSSVYFVNTYSASTSNNVVHGTMVNQQSMPSVSWWNTFSDDFYATNSLWAQDGSGRLYLVD